MAIFTRTNPTPVARGTIQRTNAQSVYKVVLSGSGLAVAASDEAAAKISDAFGTAVGTFNFKADGNEIYCVVDKHALDINQLAILVAQVLDTGAFAVDGGVATLSDSQTVTVTEPTTLEGM